jgi:hypothetical protein
MLTIKTREGGGRSNGRSQQAARVTFPSYDVTGITYKGLGTRVLVRAKGGWTASFPRKPHLVVNPWSRCGLGRLGFPYNQKGLK